MEYLNIRTEKSVKKMLSLCVCLAPVMHVCVTLCDYTVTSAGFWFTAEYIGNKTCSKFACRQKCLGRQKTDVNEPYETNDVSLWLH